MIPFASIIKKTAKDSIRNEYLKCIVSCCILIFSALISTVLFEILSYVTNYFIAGLFTFITCFFAQLPLLMGIYRYYRRIMYGEYDSPISVFYYFNRTDLYKKVLEFEFLLLFRIIAFGLVCCIPSIILKLASLPEIYERLGINIPIWTPVLSTVSAFAFGIAIFTVILWSLKYYLSFFIFVSDENGNPEYAITMSVIISKRTRLDFIYLFFNMFLYVLASFLLIPLPFTLPLIFATYTVHSIYAVKQYNDTVDSFTKQKGDYHD